MKGLKYKICKKIYKTKDDSGFEREKEVLMNKIC